jgi:serine/threonine protein kinase
LAQLLGGRWQRVGRTLGQGGQAIVEVVHDSLAPDSPEVAAKILSNPARAARFAREVALTKRLHSAGAPVLRIVDSGDTVEGGKDRPWFVTPIADRGSLRTHLVNNKPFGGSISAALAEFSRIAAAVRAIHGSMVAHRDLKPENILYFGDALVLADLGLCLDLADADASRVSADSERIGSMHYMPKEAFSRLDIDEGQYALDAYALGKLLYELVVGRRLLGFSSPAEPGYELPATFPPLLRSAVARTLRGLLHDDPTYRLPILDELEGQCIELLALCDVRAPGSTDLDFSEVATSLDRLIAPPLPSANSDDQSEVEDVIRIVSETWSVSAPLGELKGQLIRGRETHLQFTTVDKQPHMRGLLTAAFTRTRNGTEPLEDAGYPRRPVGESGHAVGISPQGELKNKLPELWLCVLAGRENGRTYVAFGIVDRRLAPSATVDLVPKSIYIIESTTHDAHLVGMVASKAAEMAQEYASIVALKMKSP